MGALSFFLLPSTEVVLLLGDADTSYFLDRRLFPLRVSLIRVYDLSFLRSGRFAEQSVIWVLSLSFSLYRPCLMAYCFNL
jgi:hypothetical protein